MKKFYYLMALMFGFVSLTSCSSDDDEKTPVTVRLLPLRKGFYICLHHADP